MDSYLQNSVVTEYKDLLFIFLKQKLQKRIELKN